MIRNRKETIVRKRHRRVKTQPGFEQEKRQSSGAQVPSTSKVPGVPPTDNLKKHPDEAYGDTEIPQRGKHLDNLKAGIN
jgi:hypothetical protein